MRNARITTFQYVKYSHLKPISDRRIIPFYLWQSPSSNAEVGNLWPAGQYPSREGNFCGPRDDRIISKIFFFLWQVLLLLSSLDYLQCFFYYFWPAWRKSLTDLVHHLERLPTPTLTQGMSSLI